MHNELSTGDILYSRIIIGEFHFYGQHDIDVFDYLDGLYKAYINMLSLKPIQDQLVNNRNLQMPCDFKKNDVVGILVYSNDKPIMEFSGLVKRVGKNVLRAECEKVLSLVYTE